MRNSLLFLLSSVLFWSKEVRSEIENEVKRGAFPFMAILYYPDETVVDSTGARFQHGAVLIKPEWLLSAAIDHSVLDGVPLGFPRKTLLARMGAITLDANYTLNEDEDEQEREIIQIIKPSIHNKEVWWLTDITLLQTLVPFKLSSAIAPTTINPKRDYADKNCAILIYARKMGNASDKVLMQLGVELLPPSVDNCGTQFSATTMTCSVPSDDLKTSNFEADYCQGNGGGPLLCEGEVMALQTYIENNCKQPHLYQLLASWDSLITCGLEQKCGVDAHCNVCIAIHKDMPSNETVITPTEVIQAIQNNTELSGLPITSTATAAQELITWSQLPPETTVEAETSYVTTTSERSSPDHSEESSVMRITTPTSEHESERRMNYIDLMNEEVSSSSTTTSTTSSSTMLTTTESSSQTPEASPWPKAISDFPTMDDDVTPKTRVESLKKPKWGNRRLTSQTHSSGNIIQVSTMFPLIILACLI